MGNLVKSTPYSEVTATLESLDAQGVTREGLKALRSNPPLARAVTALIMAGIQYVQAIYKVIVDYSLSLSEMIKLGKYELVNDDIIKHFTIQGSGKQATDLVLVTVMEVLDWLISQGQATKEQMAEKWVTTKQVIAYLASHGLLAALIEHLLAFGATYPELQRQFPIIALGSVWFHARGNRYYPSLGSDGDRRELSLRWHGDGRRWGEACRFLALRK